MKQAMDRKLETPAAARYLSPEGEGFSLIVGGPLFQLLDRAHLWGETRPLQARRMMGAAMLAWLPLLLLVAVSGSLWRMEAEVSFLEDVAVHVRFLIALPLLIAAETVVHRRMRGIVTQFLERGMISEHGMARFQCAIESALRLRNSLLAEVLLLVFVFSAGFMISRFWAVEASGWQATERGLTAAGYWYVAVSLPIFQFLLLRWYFRLFIWMRFLWQVSRIRLNLVPTHPDHVGGLSFLTATLEGFIPLAFAHGVMIAGLIADRIFHSGATLPQFQGEVVAWLLFLLGLLLFPLLFFTQQLAETKRTGRSEYGVLAQRYVREFDQKWLRGGAVPDEPLMGSGDIQALADLGNSYEVVRTMRIVPVTRDAVVTLAVATLLPMSPLLLTMMPLEVLLRKALALVL